MQFQSTRPRGRTRHSCIDLPHVILGFQSTRPRGRTRRDSYCLDCTQHGFNPRVLAGGRDAQWLSDPANKAVSIHASSREDATLLLDNINILLWFQSTRPRGRTRQDETADIERQLRFNPRVLAGGRDLCPWRSGCRISVSIHASSREDATDL